MLVPLTQSVYVAAELANTEHVLLDIGTGYFMEVRLKLSPNLAMPCVPSLAAIRALVLQLPARNPMQ